ncbi:MAG: cyclically-permuted mutarotase family protein, partial [Bacteroidaceae bacterium]|nr:cyclically-permuted mutarotase family protein [Bacteroidaceae bacterium]
VTGIDIYLCIVLMGLVTIVYCTMGGVEAVIWGDVIQGLILVGGAIFSVIYLAINTEGGFGGCIDIALDNDKFRLFDWSSSWAQPTWWVIIIGGIANNLISYTSDQTVIQRYLTTPDEKSAGRGILVNGVMSVFVSVAFYMIGTGLYTFYKTNPAELDVTMTQADAIFPFFMMSQMPAGIAGALIAAIFAATMSTISSNINSVSTAFSIDFFKRFRPATSDSQLLRVARWSSMVSGLIGLVIALFMATWNIQSLLDYFNTILGLLTSGLGGLFFIAVFMPKVKGYAALIGFIAGEAVVFWMNWCTDANLFLFGATGMVVSIVVAWIISLFTRAKN